MNSVDTFRINKQFVQLLRHNLDTNEQYFELRLERRTRWILLKI